jgi:hypothetical protein
MALNADEANLPDASGAIGTKDEAKQLGDPIIEPPAFPRVLMLLAIGARSILVALAARANLAPRRLVVFLASRTAAAQIGSARPAIQPAMGDEFRIGDDVFHHFLLRTLDRLSFATNDY